MFHIALHFIVPAIVALAAYNKIWLRAFVIMSVTIVVDLDHLLANPVYDPNRCSINFHPLHTYPAILLYAGLLFIPKVRLVGIGLLLHMALDTLDCALM